MTVVGVLFVRCAEAGALTNNVRQRQSECCRQNQQSGLITKTRCRGILLLKECN